MAHKVLQQHNTDIVDTFDDFSDEENPFPSSRKGIDQLDKDDLYENKMKKSELRQIIKEEIASFEPILKKSGRIVYTKDAVYKVLSTKPNINKPDYYLDTMVDRIQQINPNDEGNWDLDLSSYKKVIKISQ